MALDFDKISNWPFEPVEQTYTEKDSILYALGLGFGADPLDQRQLRFVFEEADGFAALPTMPVVLAGPGFWARDPETGLDWKRILHGEQGVELHGPVPPAATVIGQTRITGIIDKGAGKGALLYVERTLTDEASGAKIATLHSTIFARGDGGFAGPAGPVRPVHSLPERPPDAVCEFATLPQSALLYRLSGDPNPLHASPEVARVAGFKAPILHGLCSFGVAGHAVLKTYCDYRPERLKSFALRFSSPVYPGESIRTELWRDGDVVSFRSLVAERDAVVLDNGKAVIAP